MRHPFGIILGVGLLWLAYTLFRERAMPTEQRLSIPRASSFFLARLLSWGLPPDCFRYHVHARRRRMGWNFFFNPNDGIEETLHARALAATARGDYRAAIRDYAKAWRKDGSDVAALRSMSQLYCEQLNDPNSALKTLESALNRETSEEVIAEIEALLAEVYWRHLHDPERARLLLERIIEAFPNTKYSMNARRTLEQMERELVRRGTEEYRTCAPSSARSPQTHDEALTHGASKFRH
jgi:tetratricopeptide (TPR) repeat protein